MIRRDNLRQVFTETSYASQKGIRSPRIRPKGGLSTSDTTQRNFRKRESHITDME
ncbi:hypothetical protein FH063_001713 [Azospirillum argentinense]|uniref:Uncharacterized protein n=1 Tax=Azospirillum argentinense TaxID=2970906 RepID=A0A5B0KZR6_9PROT|nr:hypothetical protein FH063_001713 [Azospirillum argentinense]